MYFRSSENCHKLDLLFFFCNYKIYCKPVYKYNIINTVFLKKNLTMSQKDYLDCSFVYSLIYNAIFTIRKALQPNTLTLFLLSNKWIPVKDNK